MIGLEFGPTIAKAYQDNQDPGSVSKPLMEFLDVACKPAVEYLTLLLSKIEDNGVMPTSKVQQMAGEIGEILYKASYECSQLGSDITGQDYLASILQQEEQAGKLQAAQSPDGLLGKMAEKAIFDPDSSVRSTASDAVSELFPGGKEGLEHFIQTALNGLKDSANRATMAGVLISLGDVSLPYVMPLLDSPNSEIRRTAIQIIRQIKELQQMRK